MGKLIDWAKVKLGLKTEAKPKESKDLARALSLINSKGDDVMSWVTRLVEDHLESVRDTDVANDDFEISRFFENAKNRFALECNGVSTLYVAEKKELLAYELNSKLVEFTEQYLALEHTMIQAKERAGMMKELALLTASTSDDKQADELLALIARTETDARKQMNAIKGEGDNHGGF